MPLAEEVGYLIYSRIKDKPPEGLFFNLRHYQKDKCMVV
jgi:hypothetical protein